MTLKTRHQHGEMNDQPDTTDAGDAARRLRLENVALRRELDEFRALFNSLPLGIYRTTPDGQILLANETVAQLLGAPVDGDTSLLERAMQVHQIGCARGTFRETLERDGEVRDFEDAVGDPAGGSRYIKENARIVRGTDGMPLYYECTLEDVTQRREAEAALRASEERYRSVVEQSPAGILLIDDHLHIVYANDETCYILGRTRTEVLGHEFPEFVHRDDVELMRDRYFRRQAGEVVPPRYETRILRPDGEVRHLVLSATTYRNSSDSTRTVAQILDITERTKAEQVLRDYASELEVRNTELDAFADSVAHDLRSPLGAIVGFAETLQEEDGKLTAAETRQAVKTIARMGRKMDAIIEALLLFARIRKTAVKPEPVDMGPLVEEVLHRLADTITANRAELVVPSHWPLALGYGPWLEEVWANYISNAISYGGSPPRIELGANLIAKGYVRFWVHDNGDGITPKMKERLFGSFIQQDVAHGHGLGLSIVKRIVDKLDGYVGVESSAVPGEGSTFSFDLPAAIIA